MQVTCISKLDKDWNETYFFSTDHCQKHELGEDFVPITSRLPMVVTPREGLESGIIRTIDEYRFVFLKNGTEIPNPDPKFKPDYIN